MHGDREEKRSKTPPCRRSALRSAAHQNELDKLQKAISQYDAAIERKKKETASLEFDIKQAETHLIELDSQLRTVTANLAQVQRVDRKTLKKEKTRRERLEKRAEEIYRDFFSELENSMKIKISFDKESAIFTVNEDEFSTFSQLRYLVSSFFHVKPEDIFFTDDKGVIYGLDLNIRQYLFPLSTVTLVDYVPHLTIILTCNKHVHERVRRTSPLRSLLAEVQTVEDVAKNGSKEEFYYKHSTTMKEISKQGSGWYQKFRKIKEAAFSVIFLIIIALWAVNVYNDNRYFQSYLMQRDLKSVLKGPFTEINTQMPKGLVLLDWVRLIKQPYKSTDCLYLNDFYRKAYSSHGKSCYDASQLDTDSFDITVGNKIETYDYWKSETISIRTLFGTAKTEGFVLDINWASNSTTSAERFEKWMDHFRMVRFEAFVANLYNPSNQMLAQVHMYNNSVYGEGTQSEVSVQCISLAPPAANELAVRITLIIFSCLAIFIDFLSTFRLVSNKYAPYDAEILLKEEYSRCIALDLPPPTMLYHYWTFKFKYFVFIIYRPTQDQAITFATMVLLVVDWSLKSQLVNQLRNLEIVNVGEYLDMNQYMTEQWKVIVMNAVIMILLLFKFIKTLKSTLQSILPEVTYYEEMLRALVAKLCPVILFITYVLALLAIANQLTLGAINPTYSTFLKSFANALQTVLRASKTKEINSSHAKMSQTDMGGSATELIHSALTTLIVVFWSYNMIIAQASSLIEKERSRIVKASSLLKRISAKGANLFKISMLRSPRRSSPTISNTTKDTSKSLSPSEQTEQSDRSANAK